MPWNGLQIQDCCCSRQHGVIALLRRGCRMRSFSVKIRIQLGRGQSMPRGDTDPTGMLLRSSIHMSTKQKIHVFKMPILHNGSGSPDAFLCRLENEFDSSMKLLPDLAQKLCSAQSHGNMPVMSAGMHITFLLRAEPFPHREVFICSALCHRQRIDIEPQSNRWPISAAQYTDYPGQAAALRHTHACFCSAYLLTGQNLITSIFL